MPKDKGGIRRQMNWKQKVDKVRTLRTPTFQGGHSQLATTPVDTPTVAWRELLLKAQRISAVRSPCLSRLGVPRAFSFAHGAALSTAHTNLSTAHGGRKNVSVRNRVFQIDSKMAPQVPMADKCHALFKLPCSWKKMDVLSQVRRWKSSIVKFVHDNVVFGNHIKLDRSRLFTFLMCN